MRLNPAFTLLLLTCTLPPLPNNRPDPPVISGPNEGYVDSTYTFTLLGRDPDSNNIKLHVAWGDGDTSDWTPFIHSGETTQVTHAWTEPGTYTLRAQAMDWKDSVSDWSDHAVFVFVPGGWTRTFGGMHVDYGYGVAQADDGGYAAAAYTRSYGAGDYDAWLIRTDASGNRLWDRTYGGTDSDGADDVVSTPDGGWLILGSTCSYGTDGEDIWLVRTDADGNLLWDKTYGGPRRDVGRAIAPTPDGGFIILGATYRTESGWDLWLLKTDQDGNCVWDRTFGGQRSEWADGVTQTADGGYIVAATTASYGAGENDVWLIRTDANGNLLWHRSYGGKRSERGRSVIQTPDLGFLVGAESRTVGTGDSKIDVWLIRTDANGNVLWDSAYGAAEDDWSPCLSPTPDGHYAVAADTRSWGAGFIDLWLFKIDDEGQVLWTSTAGAAGHDESRSMKPTADGGFIIAGFTNSSGEGHFDVWLVKTDAHGGVEP